MSFLCSFLIVWNILEWEISTDIAIQRILDRCMVWVKKILLHTNLEFSSSFEIKDDGGIKLSVDPVQEFPNNVVVSVSMSDQPMV